MKLNIENVFIIKFTAFVFIDNSRSKVMDEDFVGHFKEGRRTRFRRTRFSFTGINRCAMGGGYISIFREGVFTILLYLLSVFREGVNFKVLGRGLF